MCCLHALYWTELNISSTDSNLEVAYENIVIQIKNHTDIIHLNVVLQSFTLDGWNQYLQFCTVVCVSAYNYIKNNRPSQMHIFLTQKGLKGFHSMTSVMPNMNLSWRHHLQNSYLSSNSVTVSVLNVCSSVIL